MKNILLTSIMVVFVVAGIASAYGPSIHMREARQYIVECHHTPMPGLEHDPEFLRENKWFLRLGSIWPDIARVLTADWGGVTPLVDENIVDPHNRHFNRYLLEKALEEHPVDTWRIALATGCLLHNTGDLVAQDLLTQHMAVRAYTGELDVIPGYFDDHPGGETESLVEGGLEFAHPAFRLYIIMTWHFIVDPEGREDLLMVMDYYLQEYADYFGLNRETSLDVAMATVEGMLSTIPWQIPTDHGDEALYRFAATGFKDLSLLGGTLIDWDELFRILGGPASTREFWDIYYTEGYSVLSPRMMLTFETGQGYFDHFPNWSAKMMKSGMIQSLNHYLPDRLAAEDGRFLMSLDWIDDDTGKAVTSIDAATPPSSITLTATLYETTGRSPTEDVVSLRVREDSEAGALVSWAAGDVGMDPWDFENFVPESLSVTFDPAPSIGQDAAGFFAELAQGDDPIALPYFTTDWSVYTQIEEIDFTKDAYTRQYSTYDHWPYSLSIIR